MNNSRLVAGILLLCAATCLIAGCTKQEKTAAGVIVGAAVGAGIGGAAGGGGGAVAGGVVGGVTGGLVGHSLGDDKK